MTSSTSPSTLSWVIAIVATAIGAGALGYFAGRYTAPTPVAAAPIAPATNTGGVEASDGAPQLPPGTTTETIGDWILFCQDAPGGGKACSATQDIVNDKGQVILSVIAGYEASAQRAFLVRTPLGVDLNAGLEFNLPGDKPVAFEFTACDQMSCNAILTVPDANYPKLEAAGAFELAYTRGDGVRVPVKISLKGLSDAFAKIEKPVPETPPAPPAAPETPAAAPEGAAPAPAPTPAGEPAPAPEGTPTPTPKPVQP